MTSRVGQTFRKMNGVNEDGPESTGDRKSIKREEHQSIVDESSEDINVLRLFVKGDTIRVFSPTLRIRDFVF